MPSFDNPNEELIYQIGLNTIVYQNIEKLVKQIIKFSSFSMSSQEGEEQLELVFSNDKTAFMTLGGLLGRLAEVKKNSENDTKEEPDENQLTISISLSHHIFDFDGTLAQEAKKIIKDRNDFIHHLDFNEKNLLQRLKKEYIDGKDFYQKLHKQYELKVEYVRHYIIFFMNNMDRLNAIHLFDSAFQKHKRKDGWAVWQLVLNEINQQSNGFWIKSLKENSQYKKWIDIIKSIYPKWQFREEKTEKGSRLLVKIDNSKWVLKGEIPTINLANRLG